MLLGCAEPLAARRLRTCAATARPLGSRIAARQRQRSTVGKGTQGGGYARSLAPPGMHTDATCAHPVLLNE